MNRNFAFTRRNFLGAGALAAAAALRPMTISARGQAGEPAVFTPDLDIIRALATVIPGELPRKINAVKVADSIRPSRVVFEGGDDTPHTMSRTLYQLEYADSTLMIDTGMDATTHRQFGQEGKPFTDPFYEEVFTRSQSALDEAAAIWITHFHADHVGGLVVSPNRESLFRKSWITRQTAALMKESPHKPAVRVDPGLVDSAMVFDYDQMFPLAPGLVAIRAPGHSHDHQMGYMRLHTGQEFLLSIDSAWHMDHIRLGKLKAAPWVKEDKPQLLAQYAWLRGVEEKGITILVTHDNDQLQALTASGVLGADCKLAAG